MTTRALFLVVGAAVVLVLALGVFTWLLTTT
jgi:hypothetical protein